jgi:hypothetical protein
LAQQRVRFVWLDLVERRWLLEVLARSALASLTAGRISHRIRAIERRAMTTLQNRRPSIQHSGGRGTRMAWYACRVSLIYGAPRVSEFILRRLGGRFEVRVVPSRYSHTVLVGARVWSRQLVDSILSTKGVFRFVSDLPLSSSELRRLVLADDADAFGEGFLNVGADGLQRDWLTPQWAHWGRRNLVAGIVAGCLLAASVLATAKCS